MSMTIAGRPAGTAGFRYFSVHNAVQAELACPTAECRAYSDILTARRWVARGFAVRKGEVGTPISTWIPIIKAGPGGERQKVGKRPMTTVVYCRHQVAPRR